MFLHFVWPDDGDALPGLDAEADVLQQLSPRPRLAQGNLVELQVLRHRRDEGGLDGLADAALTVEEVEEHGSGLAAAADCPARLQERERRPVQADDGCGQYQ